MLGNEAAMKINKVLLPNDTVNRRILEMSTDIEKNVCGNKLECSDFALQVDDSTDITNNAQPIAFIRFNNEIQIKISFFFAKN